MKARIAVGMLLLVVATGHLPLLLSDPGWKAERLAHGQAALVGLPEGYPLGLTEVVRSCLSAMPSHRPPSAANILQMLYPEMAIEPYCPTRWKRRTEALGWLEEGRLEAARRVWSEICRQEPHDAWSLNNWGVALARLGHLSQAREKFRQAVHLLPDNAVVAANLGWAVLKTGGHQQEALEWLRRSLSLEPHDARSYYLRALCRQGHHAIGDLLQALWLAPDRTEIYLALAARLEEAEQFDAARLRREQAAQCRRPVQEVGPEPIRERQPGRWTGGVNESAFFQPAQDNTDEDDGEGGAGVPLRWPPHRPAGAEARALPQPHSYYQHAPSFLSSHPKDGPTSL